MSATPSWLAAGNDAPPASASLEVSGTSATASPASTQNAGVSQNDDEKDLPSIILMMRLTNMGMAAALITVSVFTLIPPPAISTFILALYSICGALLICCLETQLKFLRVIIAVNFGFLFNSTWRFLFYMILSSVCWSWDTTMGRIMSIAIASVAVFNTYVLCRYPGYRRMREKIAEEEDKRIESRISKEVKKQAVGQMMKK